MYSSSRQLDAAALTLRGCGGKYVVDNFIAATLRSGPFSLAFFRHVAFSWLPRQSVWHTAAAQGLQDCRCSMPWQRPRD